MAIKQGKVELGKNNTCLINSTLIKQCVWVEGKNNPESYIDILIYYSDYFHVASDVILRKRQNERWICKNTYNKINSECDKAYINVGSGCLGPRKLRIGKKYSFSRNSTVPFGKMVQQEVRKGPWTEQEDFKLVYFVGLFGDRRWDFIAKVSGLNRTGKSCRLRWVNYLHPGLKRGKMTPQEERLVLELHSKWGNRWSRIARKLPGRTDNEIKNYWRTLMRKKAQEKKRGEAASPTPSSVHSSISSNKHAVDPHASKKAGEESFYDTGGPSLIGSSQDEGQGFSMDDIWKDIDMSVYDGHSEEGCNFSCPQVPSPSWEYSSSDPLWVMDEESLFCPMSSTEPYFSYYAQGSVFLTG